MRKAVAALARANIPSLVVGGYALSSYLGSPLSRLRDLSDVVELMKLNQIPRDFPLDPTVEPTFRQTWDGLEAENSR